MKLKDVLIASVFALAVATSASAAPYLTLRYGRTDVALGSGFLSALESLQVTPSPLKSSLIRKGVIIFPISVGRLDQENLKGEILHTGGLRLHSSTKVVDLSQFAIDTTGATPVLTGIATVDGSVIGRIPLFDLSLPAVSLPLPKLRKLRLGGVGVKLNKSAADALNSLFGVTAFAEGLDIGVAKVRAIATQP